MTINQVKCDGCGKVEEKVSVDGWSDSPKNPSGWKYFIDKDLCPTCVEKVEEFIQGLKV